VKGHINYLQQIQSKAGAEQVPGMVKMVNDKMEGLTRQGD